MITLAGAFDNRKWCVHTEGLSEHENHSDDDGDSGEDQGSDDDGYSGDGHGSDDAHSEADGDSGDDQDSDHAGDSGTDDFPEPIKYDGHKQMVFLGSLNAARGLGCKINEFTSPLASPPKRPLDMIVFEVQL
jgi:hypothetical protein